MTTQITRFIVSKSVEVTWDGDCDQCRTGAMWINRMTLSSDETRLVVYLECVGCGSLRVMTFEPLEYSPHTVSQMEV